MPKTLQQKIINAIKKSPRIHNGLYDKRIRIQGIDVYGCASNIEECEERFLKDLTQKFFSDQQPAQQKFKPTMLFHEWASKWMDEVHKPDVAPITFKNDMFRLKNHINPFFGNKRLNEIQPLDCIKFCNGLIEKGYGRTAEECYGIAKRILQFAVDSELIAKNPMSVVKPVKSDRENGVPLTPEEEHTLLTSIKGQKYEPIIVVALYTGLRPCEYYSAKIDGKFIKARNHKQRRQKIVHKKIPITPMLQPYLPIIEELLPVWENYLTIAKKQFKKILPNHKPYDMRTTFATRCQECGVPENVVQCWMGHKAKTLLGNTYTKFSDEYFLREGDKVKY